MERSKQFLMKKENVQSGGQQGYTIVLEDLPVTETGSDRAGSEAAASEIAGSDRAEKTAAGAAVYRDTPVPLSAGRQRAVEPEVPEKIREMKKLYEYGDVSFAGKRRNFYRQGKFMEQYVDDAPRAGEFRHYFPTYHDLSVRQLRGYFSWRALVRRGEFRPISSSFAYIYLYELLCGIGTVSPEDSLQKMQDFRKGFLDTGIGDPGMRKNLYRWMLEYAVLHSVPAETARQYADPALVERDRALAALRSPGQHSDEELFNALCVYDPKRLMKSPVISAMPERGRHLFAAVWRIALEKEQENGKKLFHDCFGEQKAFAWYPLANAIYWEPRVQRDVDYELDECRSYTCRNGRWHEMRYDHLYFDLSRFRSLMHEADRVFRREYHAGHYLHERPEEAWAAPYAEAVVEEERHAAVLASRPEIKINFSDLDQIRRDAGITRDSLLTEEEMEEVERPDKEKPSEKQFNEKPVKDQNEEKKAEDQNKEKPAEGPGKRKEADRTDLQCEAVSAAGLEEKRSGQDAEERGFDNTPEEEGIALNPKDRHILISLLRGEPVDAYIREQHMMPSVAADEINEALYGEIGDNVLDCDGEDLTIVEDYRPDLMEILGEKSF